MSHFQGSSREPATAKLHDKNLRNQSADPDYAEKRIAEEALEDIAFSVDLARVNFVAQCHQDEGIEDDRKMLWGWGIQQRPTKERLNFNTI